jgi:hypothetical protein
MSSLVKTIWRTATHQCEIAHDGIERFRLLLWVNGVLKIDEEVFDLQLTMMRALELRRLVTG